MQTDHCYSVEYIPTFLERIGRKLFPAALREEPKELKVQRDAVISNVTVALGFSDRMRVLFSGRLFVNIRTVTENEVGNHSTAAVAYPLPPKFLTR